MPIGKGYFWEGLSQGVRGLYGSMQNERMANEAQGAREQEGSLNRAQSAAQFNQLLPAKGPKDDFPQVFDTVEEAASAASNELSRAAAALKATEHSEPGVKYAAQMVYQAASQKKAQADADLKGFTQKGALRGGVDIPDVPKAINEDEEFMKNLMKPRGK